MTGKRQAKVPLSELLDPSLALQARELPGALSVAVPELSDRGRAAARRIVRQVLEVPVWSDAGTDYGTQLFMSLLLDSMFEVESLATARVMRASMRWLFCDP